jgi:8-amino-7-oxononanoate synthase
LRSLKPPAGIDLCSNDYLGLATDPYLKTRMAEAVEQEGCGSTGSRLLRGERTAFSALEKRFAGFKGTEAALYFSSGYSANLAVLSTFPERGDSVLSDRLNHASLKDGVRLSIAQKVILPHADPGAVRRSLQSASTAGQRFLVTESVYSMDGDFAPLAEYAAICRESGTALIVDEAHAVGIYGQRGSGLIEATGTTNDVFLSINPAAKALGVGGAFVAGPAWAIQYLMQCGRSFVFSSAPPPAMTAALDAALDLIACEPQRRHRVVSLSAALRCLLRNAGIPVPAEGSQIIPIHIGDNSRAIAVAAALQADGFDVRAIRPPTVPPGTARLRISINAKLDASDLCRFAASLSAALRKFTVQPQFSRQ